MPKERVYGQIKHNRIAIRSVDWPHRIWDTCKDNPINRVKFKLRILRINNSYEMDEISIRLYNDLKCRNIDTSTLSPVQTVAIVPRFVDSCNNEIEV